MWVCFCDKSGAAEPVRLPGHRYERLMCEVEFLGGVSSKDRRIVFNVDSVAHTTLPDWLISRVLLVKVPLTWAYACLTVAQAASKALLASPRPPGRYWHSLAGAVRWSLALVFGRAHRLFYRAGI